MRISDWSSDVCSSDLRRLAVGVRIEEIEAAVRDHVQQMLDVDIAVRLTTQIHVHRGRVDLIVPLVVDRPLDAQRAAIGAGARFIMFDRVGQTANERRILPGRPEERRVGKECVSTCRSRWSQYNYKKKKAQ